MILEHMLDDMDAEIHSLRQEVEDLRYALIWALTWLYHGHQAPKDSDGEAYEDYSGATRLAWPDNPEEWS